MRETVGTYKLLERSGEDLLGETWRARDTARGRTAFVRIVHPALTADPAKRAKLVADARKAAAVSHPSIAALFDVIEEGSDIALAHEHVEGRSLAATLGGTALNPRMAVAIGIQIADGLADLHANELTHGAVDATQVVITPRGQAKLLDAGLAPWLGTAAPTDDIAALGKLLSTMAGGALPRAQWADDLKLALERTRPDHPKRYQAVATLAAELRSVSAMLEARADALPPVSAGGSGKSVVLWALLAIALLAAGVWFLLL